MFKKLLLIFIVVPILELLVLIEVGQRIGIAYSLLIIVITGFAGVTLAKHQGFLVLNLLQQKMSRGEMPADEIVDGLLILAGALLLLTPGLITDSFGFLAIIPPTRLYLRKIIKGILWGYLVTGKIRFRKIR
ncbi:MAG: FxsA family protein [Bacillota bacterium]